MQASTSVNEIDNVNISKSMGPFNGVTLNKNTRCFEACIWIANAQPASNNKRTRGRQLYCGSYMSAVDAAKAHDMVLMALHGCCFHKRLNFTAEPEEAAVLHAEGVASVRSRVIRDGRFTRTRQSMSGYTGVTQKGGSDMFEARARVTSNKKRSGSAAYTFLGTFATAEEAARAYDTYVLAHRGHLAVTNFVYSEEERLAGATDPLEDVERFLSEDKPQEPSEETVLSDDE